MLNVNEDLLPRLDAGLHRLVSRQPLLQGNADALRSWFSQRYGGLVLRTTDSLVQFMTTLGAPQVPAGTAPEVSQVLESVRLQMVNDLILSFSAAREAVAALPDGDVLAGQSLVRNRRRIEPGRRQELNDMARRYLGMMSAVSPDALATALEAAGEISGEEFATFTGLLGQALNSGGAVPTDGVEAPATFLQYDRDLLQMPGIREYVGGVLRRAVYKYLAPCGIDTVAGRPGVFADIEQRVEDALYELARQAGITTPQELDPLFAEIIRFYADVRHLSQTEIPALDCFVEAMPDHHGQMLPFASLRQLVSTRLLFPRQAKDEDDIPKQYNCLRPGDGKTALPFIVWELRRRRRRRQDKPEEQLLYLLPPSTIDDIPNQVRQQAVGFSARRFYRDGYAPQTGVISSAMPTQGRAALFDQAIAQPVVFAPITMGGSLDGRGAPIWNRLVGMEQKMVAIDEAPEICGGDDRPKMVRRLLRGANLRLLMSATPTAKDRVHGARRQLELLIDAQPAQTSIETVMAAGDDRRYRPSYSETMANSRGRVSPYLLTLDEPIDHSPRWSYEGLDVVPDSPQANAIRAIINETGAGFWNKYRRCLIASRAPWLMRNGAESAMLERTQGIIAERLEQDRVIIVSEEQFAEGITRPSTDWPGDTFADRLGAFVATLNADYAVIHGEVTAPRRRAIRDQMRAARQPGARPFVLMTMSECIRTGLDLSAAELLIRLGPPFSIESLTQEFARLYRAGHDTPEMILLYIRNTVEEIKLRIAQAYRADELRWVHGDTLPPDRLHALMQGDEALIGNGQLSYGLSSSEELYGRVDRTLHSEGTNGVYRYWQGRQAEWEGMHLGENDRSGIGRANVQRFTAAMLERLDATAQLGQGPIVEVGSQGLSVARHARRLGSMLLRQHVAIEPHQFMLDRGSDFMMTDTHGPLPQRHEGTALSIPVMLADGRLEQGGAGCVVLGDLHHMRWDAPQGSDPLVFGERAQALLNARRLGETLVVPMPHDACTLQEFKNFCRALPRFGWTVLPGFTGTVASADGIGEPPSRMYVAVARRTEGRAPSRSSVLPQLSHASLRFTHCSEWGQVLLGRRNQELATRRLPYPPISTTFRVQPLTAPANPYDVEYAHPLPMQDIQRQHLAAICAAAQSVRSLAPTVAEWRALPEEQRAPLAARGVIACGGVQRPGFSLNGYPEHVFFPYDPQFDPE